MNSRLARRNVVLALAVSLAVSLAVVVVVFTLRPRFAAEHRWNAVLTRGQLRVGIDPSVRPFSFFGAQGWEGYDADVMREIARRLDVEIEAIPVGYDGFYDALTTGRVDVSMSALVPDATRLNAFGFSDAYIDVGVRLIGRQAARYRGAEDLRHHAVAVVLGGEADRLARRLERRVAGFDRKAVGDSQVALQDFRLGNSQWVLLDGLDAISAGCESVARNDGATHTGDISCFALQPQPYVVALASADNRLRDEINRTLQKMQTDGTLNRLADKWMHD